MIWSLFHWSDLNASALSMTHGMNLRIVSATGKLANGGSSFILTTGCGKYPALGNGAKCTLTSVRDSSAHAALVGWYDDSYSETITLPTTGQPLIESRSLADNLEFSLAFPGNPVQTGTTRDLVPRWRCDNTINGRLAGCVSPAYASTIDFNTQANPLVDPVARHMQDAQNSLAGHPGDAAYGHPLHRLTDQTKINANRSAACGSSPPEGPFTYCDEYPFASTYEGGAGASTRMVPSSANDSQGGILGGGYGRFRILDNDPYYVSITIAPKSGPNVMVVGDSISQGLEGDYTWRYRLYQHFAANKVFANFVGPWTGTTRLPSSVPDGYPDVSSPPNHTGAYRPGIGFDTGNYAQWGWQMHQAKDSIQTTVSQYQPDYLLVELGFNDLGWGISTPDGLITDLRSFVANARAGRPDVKIIIGNVLHRTPLSINPDLPANISSYNSKLTATVPGLSTAASPVVSSDLDGPYNENTDSYDGLHPNGHGEYLLARSFANTLSAQFGIGPAFGTVPASVPDLTPGPPSTITATATDAGITVAWSHVFGAGAYWLYQRDVTNGESFARSALSLPADSWKIGWVLNGHQYQFKVVTARGSYESTSSGIASATGNTKTADGPTAITVNPGATHLDLGWSAPTGTYSSTVRAYKVYWLDQNVPGAFLDSQTVTTTTTRVAGLVAGHRYTLAISSINLAGEGVPSGAPDAIPGGGRPAAPTLVSAYFVDNGTVDLTWTAVAGGAHYWIWNRDTTTSNPYTTLPQAVVGTTYRIGWLFPAASNFSFCVQAANGTQVSPMSNCRGATTRPSGAGAAARTPLTGSAETTVAQVPTTVPVDTRMALLIRAQAH